MSAETLRKAAHLMRERAEAAGCAIGENWRMGDRSTLYTVEFQGNDDVWRNAFDCGPCNEWNLSIDVKHEYVGTGEEPAEHMASWHPAVALAVADWLDNEATQYAANKRLWDVSSLDPSNRWAERGLTVTANLEHHHGAALKVARAYLGESA